MTTRHGLTKMTRVEVVVVGDDVALVRDVFEAAGVAGFTAVSNVAGLGHGGYHQGRLLFNDTDSLVILYTVVLDELADALVAGIQTILAERPGVMFVSDTYVSRPDYFRREDT